MSPQARDVFEFWTSFAVLVLIVFSPFVLAAIHLTRYSKTDEADVSSTNLALSQHRIEPDTSLERF